MGTLNLRWFTNEECLRSVTPEFLLRMLAPHAGYFKSRGVLIPAPGEAGPFDYDGLRAVFINPDRDTPATLIDSLYYVNEMATPECMDNLLDALAERGLSIGGSQEQTPIDVALQVWLLDPDLLQEKHAERHLGRPRSFEYFQSERMAPLDFVMPDAQTRRRLEQTLDAWFSDHKRGSGARVFVYPRQDGVWFLIRHGEPYRREGSMENGEPGSVAYRPLKFDVVVFEPGLGEIRMNAGTVGEKTLYREAIGLHLFGDKAFFPGKAKYKLEPLQSDGIASLVCTDIEGLESVRLKEVHFFRGGSQGEIEIRKAKDVFAAYGQRDASLPSARIVKAVFEVKFSGCKTPRSVIIKPSNIAQYSRDHDSVHVERWLVKRGFTVGGEP